MDQISCLTAVKNHSGGQSTTLSSQKPLGKNLTEILFLRLGAIFGQMWSSRHHDDTQWEITKDEWSEGLAGIKPVNIKKALDQLRQEKVGYPPTLPEFISLCRSFEDKFFKAETNTKTLTFSEKSNVQEIMKKGKEMTFDEKIKHPVWDKKRYTVGSKSFCLEHFRDRRDYLINLTEIAASNLETEDKYDRICFLRQQEWENKYNG